MALLLLAGIAGLCGLPVLAIKGVGYRGVYFALALIAAVLALVVFALIPSPLELARAVASTDPSLARGTQALFDYGPAMTLFFGAIAIGGLLGAALYRTASPRSAAEPSQ